jgi:hypothetical protein
MKRLIVTAALGLVAVGALAQGQFTFGNRNPLSPPAIDAPVKNASGELCSGETYLAQAYVKLQADTVWTPVGAAVPFRTGTRAGYINSVVVTTPYAGGTAVQVQMRAWEAIKGQATYPDYDAAFKGGAQYGESNIVPLNVAVAPNTPPDMNGLTGFTLVPEPSTLALGVLGVAALLLRRRS